ncbi:MAG: LPXTG cell wall anchor domain-containing protein [Ilumatobacteraceae bacterium]
MPTTGSKNQSNLFVIAVLLFVFGIVIRRTSAVISEDWQVARFTVPRV